MLVEHDFYEAPICQCEKTHAILQIQVKHRSCVGDCVGEFGNCEFYLKLGNSELRFWCGENNNVKKTLQ